MQLKIFLFMMFGSLMSMVAIAQQNTSSSAKSSAGKRAETATLKTATPKTISIAELQQRNAAAGQAGQKASGTQTLQQSSPGSAPAKAYQENDPVYGSRSAGSQPVATETKAAAGSGNKTSARQ